MVHKVLFVSAIINGNNKNYQPQLLRRNFFLMRFLNASIYSGNFSHTDDFECERLKIYLRIKVSDNAYLADVNFLSFLFFFNYIFIQIIVSYFNLSYFVSNVASHYKWLVCLRVFDRPIMLLLILFVLVNGNCWVKPLNMDIFCPGEI